MSRAFHIHAPGADVETIGARAESMARSIPAEEKARVAALSFAPSSRTDTPFDAFDTGELFERPVELPDFQSKKYRWVKGPLRWFAHVFFRFISVVYDKLSENKNTAFYQIVQEVVALKHRVLQLQEQVEILEKQNAALKGKSSGDGPEVS
ncbi:MAG: hypothetical protein HY042_08085 [Spirochaetia bacterium]|nr:hypothetical protein [Spirochaetia bacterium]